MRSLRLAAAWNAVLGAEQGRLMLWLPVLQAAGVVLYFSLSAEPPWWVGGALLAVSLALWWGLRSYLVPRVACALVAALAFGFALIQFATWRAAPLVELPSRATIVTGTVAAVDALEEGRRVVIERPRLDDGPALPRSLRIRLHKGDDAAIATGDRVSLRALLMPPPSPAWPGGWDLQRDVFYTGLGGYGYALNPAVVLARDAPRGLAGWTQRLRERLAARIGAVLGPGAVGGLATALLSGVTHGIPQADHDAFRNSGLAHLLAISGLHIGIVMGLCFGLVRFVLVRSEYLALRWPVKQVAALAALAAGGGYTLLTGGQVPMLRSFLMACLVTLALLAGRRAFSLRGLALALALVLVAMPASVMGASLQMSFAAVLALVAGYEALRPWLRQVHGDGSRPRRVLAHIVGLVVTSVLAGTATAPFGAYHFGHIQVYFILANLVAVPLTAFWVMPAGMVALALMPLHLEALALVPMGWGIEAVLAVAHGVSSLPSSVLAAPHMPPWGLAILAFGMAWLGLWRSRLRLGGVALIALGLASPAFGHTPDLLVSAEARLIGLRTPEGVFVSRVSGASRYTEEAWLRLWAVEQAAPFPACGGDACVIWPAPRVVLVRPGAPAEVCGAALVVSAEPVDLHCTGAVIDRFTVWRTGAQAVWFTQGGVRIVSDRGWRGERPWVIPLPTRSAIPPGVKLTPALAEKLPEP